jgi:hypothetical protein
MRLCEPMVIAMGGRSAKPFAEFVKLATRAYLILRRNAALFLAMFSLVDVTMLDRTGKLKVPEEKVG